MDIIRCLEEYQIIELYWDRHNWSKLIPVYIDIEMIAYVVKKIKHFYQNCYGIPSTYYKNYSLNYKIGISFIV